MEFSADELRAPLPAGTYVMTIRNVRERQSRNNNPLVEVLLEVQDGEFMGEPIRDYFVTEGPNHQAARVGRRRLLRLCRICDIRIQPDQDVDLSSLVGNSVFAEVLEDSYHGVPVSRIRTYHPMIPDGRAIF